MTKIKKSGFIIEGALAYLTEEKVKNLFGYLDELTGQETRVVFTITEPMTRYPSDFGPILKFYLKLKGEPLTLENSVAIYSATAPALL